MSRLDEARSPVANVPELKKTPIDGMSPLIASRFVPLPIRNTAEPKGPHTTPKNVHSKTEYEDSSDILEKLCEYLFDLFDANCMDDYIRMERFELRAVEAFKGDEMEFTHEQHDLHKEFVALFEQLVEGFLSTEDYSIDEFYQELKHFLQVSGPKSKPKLGGTGYYDSGLVTPADEVMEVISSYMQFDVWAGLMRRQAQQRGAFLTIKDKLNQAAAAQVSDHSSTKTDRAVSVALFKENGQEETQEKGGR